ncbi:MAG: hypothetical protein HOM21_05135, partial [Halobacteriovoraceae bacterium]|nr:hypothetical protein [Halobacteriovoraceae bacterium]
MRNWNTYKAGLIVDLLQTAMAKEPEVLVWQTEGENREKFKGEILDVDETNTVIALDESYLSSGHQFNSSEPLMFNCSEGSIIFKKSAYKLEGGSLSFKTPAELKIIDQRQMERFPYMYQDYKNISFTQSKGEEIHKYSCTLVDISTEGAGFVLTTRDHENFVEESRINVTALSDQQLPEPVNA